MAKRRDIRRLTAMRALDLLRMCEQYKAAGQNQAWALGHIAEALSNHVKASLARSRSRRKAPAAKLRAISGGRNG